VTVVCRVPVAALEASACQAAIIPASVDPASADATCAAIVIPAGVLYVSLVFAVVGSPRPNPMSSRSTDAEGVIPGDVIVDSADTPPLSVTTATSSGVVPSAPCTATHTAANRPDVPVTVGLASPACMTRRYTAMQLDVDAPEANDAATVVHPEGAAPIDPADARSSANM
jgi:hypothetical protein